MVHERRDLIGWTVFLLDDGIDTGAIIAQETLVPEANDTHMSLSWKGMDCEAKAQARVILALDAGDSVPVRPIRSVPPDSYFGPPDTASLVRYWQANRRVNRPSGSPPPLHS